MPIALPEVKDTTSSKVKQTTKMKKFSTPPTKVATVKKTKPVKLTPVAKKVVLDNNKVQETVVQTALSSIEHNPIEDCVKIEKHVVPPWENTPVVQEQKPKTLNFQDVLKSMQQVQPVVPSFMKR